MEFDGYWRCKLTSGQPARRPVPFGQTGLTFPTSSSLRLCALTTAISEVRPVVVWQRRVFAYMGACIPCRSVHDCFASDILAARVAAPLRLRGPDRHVLEFQGGNVSVRQPRC